MRIKDTNKNKDDFLAEINFHFSRHGGFTTFFTFMARIAGVNLPKGKRIEIALTYIYGIGRTTSRKLLNELKIDPDIKVEALSPDQEQKIRESLVKFVTEGDLRRQVGDDIKRLQEIGTYRGFRHRRHLPVRGQRTKTNARTKRGKKKTMGSGKLKVAKK